MSGTTYPLTAFDTICSEMSATAGYILSKPYGRPYDTTFLKDAIERVAEKWPFLAARVIRDKNSGLFHIHVPSERLGQPVVKFTIATHNKCLAYKPMKTPFPSISTERPSWKYFRHPSTPAHISVYASKQHPLLSVHISHLYDATCIGFTGPHGVFDAVGFSQLLFAINAELAGKDWKPPPLPDRNVFAETINSLPHTNIPEVMEHFKREWPKLTFWTGLKFFTGFFFGQYWRRLSMKSIYLDEATVKNLVATAKLEAKATGGRVTTGDVILAWFTKAALSDEADRPNTVAINSAISFRDVLSDQEPLMKHYPHNTMILCPMRLFTHAEVAKMSVAELAMHHREHINRVRTPEAISAIANYIGPPATLTPIIGDLHKSKTSMGFTNQTIGDMTSLDFGGGTKIVGFEEWYQGIELENLVCISKLQGGHVVCSKLRESRWRAVGKELAKL